VAGAPGVRVLDLDRGSSELNVERVTADSFDEVLEWIEDAITDTNIQTFAIDSLSRLEALVTAKVCGPGNLGGLAAYGGGYGKGDDAALQYWRQILGALDRLSATKHVVLVGHTQIKAFADPMGLAYDRHTLGLRDKAAGPVKQWVNYILFARVDVSTRVQETSKKNVGITSGLRWLLTDNNPAYDAKHRGNLPPQLPLSWDAFYDAVQADRGSCAERITRIGALVEQVADATLIPKIKEATRKASTDSTQLAAIIGRLEAIIDTQQKDGESK
jgi:hypothetical protein